MEPLVHPDELTGFPGAPFTVEQVKSATEQVRRQAGWHIAPVVEETLTVDSHGGTLLVLPTLHLVAVTEVRDVSGDTPRVIEGWRKSRNGTLSRRGGWPVGFETVEVDVVHGYDECPPELLAIVAERCQMFGKDGSVRQESLGSRSVSYGYIEGTATTAVLSAFRLVKRP